MLNYAWIFLVISIVAAGLGFGGISDTSTGLFEALFYVFLGIFVMSLVWERRSV